MTSPVVRSMKRARVARRGAGTGQDSAASASAAAGPETQMTAIPARPGAVAGAKMVASRSAVSRSPLGERRLGFRRFLLGLQHEARDAAAADDVGRQDLVDIGRIAIGVP